MNSISSIPANVSKIIETATEKAKTQSDIAYAVAGKQVQATKQAGDAALEMLESAMSVQSQISQGRLDVRV